MKKQVLRIVVAFITLCTAIGANAQFRYSPVVSVVASTLKFKQDLVDVSYVPGFQAGIKGELMFPGIGFGLDFGALYNLGGAKVNLGQREIWSSQGYGNERIYLHQLNIPFHLKFKWTRMNGFEDVLAPFVFGGPSFDILLAHSKCKAMEFPRGDFSLVAGVGVELKRIWHVSASYTWGMSYNMRAKILTDYSCKGNQWTISLARMF